MRTDILGVGFDSITLPQAVEKAAKLLEQGGTHYVVTPNPEMVQRAQKEPAFRAVLNGADLVLPDGVGITYAAKILGRPLAARVPGIDFASALCGELAKSGKKLFLLGAKPGVAEAAGVALAERYPGLRIAGTRDGYFREDAPVVEAIRDSGADCVFVCLGAPKQERWMAKHGAQTGAHLLCGLGGSLDVFAGVVERAPKFWCDHDLEWFYRLCRDPRRLGRMMKLPLFLVHVRKEKRRR